MPQVSSRGRYSVNCIRASLYDISHGYPATCSQQMLFIRYCRTALRPVDWLFRANWQFRPIVWNSCTRARPRNECWHDCCMLLEKCTSGTSFRLIRQFRNSFEIVVQELTHARNFPKTIKNSGDCLSRSLLNDCGARRETCNVTRINRDEIRSAVTRRANTEKDKYRIWKFAITIKSLIECARFRQFRKLNLLPNIRSNTMKIQGFVLSTFFEIELSEFLCTHIYYTFVNNSDILMKTGRYFERNLYLV